MEKRDKVIKLINEVGNSLDSPNYAEKVLTECGKEIIHIVESLEKEVEALKGSESKLLSIKAEVEKLMQETIESEEASLVDDKQKGMYVGEKDAYYNVYKKILKLQWGQSN